MADDRNPEPDVEIPPGTPLPPDFAPLPGAGRGGDVTRSAEADAARLTGMDVLAAAMAENEAWDGFPLDPPAEAPAADLPRQCAECETTGRNCAACRQAPAADPEAGDAVRLPPAGPPWPERSPQANGLGGMDMADCPDHELHAAHEWTSEVHGNLWCIGARDHPAPPGSPEDEIRSAIADIIAQAVPGDRARALADWITDRVVGPELDRLRRIAVVNHGLYKSAQADVAAATPPGRSADEIRSAIGDAISPSIRKDHLPDVMDRVMSVISRLIAELEQYAQALTAIGKPTLTRTGDLAEQAVAAHEGLGRTLTAALNTQERLEAERDEQRQRAERAEGAWRSARRRAALLVTVAAERDEAIARADQLEELLDAAHQASNEAERQREIADSVTAETKRLMQHRTETLRQRAERAEQQLIDCGADRDEQQRRASRAASMYSALRTQMRALCTCDVRQDADGPDEDCPVHGREEFRAPVIARRVREAEAERDKANDRSRERLADLADRDATIADLRRQLNAEADAQALLRDERDRLREELEGVRLQLTDHRTVLRTTTEERDRLRDETNEQAANYAKVVGERDRLRERERALETEVRDLNAQCKATESELKTAERQRDAYKTGWETKLHEVRDQAAELAELAYDSESGRSWRDVAAELREAVARVRAVRAEWDTDPYNCGGYNAGALARRIDVALDGTDGGQR